METKIVTLVLLCWLLLFPTCKKKPTEHNDTDKPGRRDYTWTIDTLSYPGSLQTTMRDMYAVDAKNIYVVGHNEDNGVGTMYHYDGTKWSSVKISWAVGGNISGAFDLSAIYGFGANDIYAVGFRYHDNPTPPPNYYDSSLIIHFDGSQWKEVNLSVRGRQLIGIWGNSSGDIWTGGGYGTLFHYDGILWANVSLDTSLWFNAFGGEKYKQFLTAYKQIDTSGYITGIKYLFKRIENNWTKVDSFALLPNTTFTFGHLNIRSIGGTIYSSGYGLFYQKNDKWENVESINDETVIRYTFGSRSKNVYAVGNAGIVYHFNGTDWKKTDEVSNPILSFNAGWTNEKEVFIMGDDNYRTYIYYGK
jgi:hypothetical protein